MVDNTIGKKTIVFPNGNEAQVVLSSAKDKPDEILAALNINSYNAVILILGGADSLDEKLNQRLAQLFGRGIARAAAEAKAVIIDGGTQAGVMAMMGEAVAGHSTMSTLLGVAPAGKVTYPGAEPTPGVQGERIPLEPNHSCFVLVEGDEWGSETSTIFKLLNSLTSKVPDAPSPAGKQPKQDSQKTASKLPALAVLAGGGPVARNEVLRAVRQKLPLIVIEGSGQLADEIAAAWKQRATLPDDPVMAEIVADGDIHLHLLSNSVDGIQRLIIRELGVDKVLMQAWEIFADYDHNAKLQQRRFDELQIAIIALGVLGTALAIAQQVYAPKESDGVNLRAFLLPPFQWSLLLTFGGWNRFVDYFFSRDTNQQRPVLWWTISHTLILVPIVLTVLVTAANRFKQGTKWLLLRAGAEAIKREIYRYRARALNYKEKAKDPVAPEAIDKKNPPQQSTATLEASKDATVLQAPNVRFGTNPEQQLAARVEDITRRTMRTEVNLSSLKPYDKTLGLPPGMGGTTADDGFSYLTPDQYVEVRLGDQLQYFQNRAIKMEKRLKALLWLTFLIGGLGTLLAAINQQAWIAVTTSVVAAIGTYLAYTQTENTLMKYNQAATDLGNVKSWWNALSAEEQSHWKNRDSLVEHTEQVLQSELDGWVQQMQNALAELRKGQETKPVAAKNETSGQPESVPPPRGDADARRAADEPSEPERDLPGEREDKKT